MIKLDELLKTGTIPMLRARRRQLHGHIKQLEKEPYSKDDVLDTHCDIMDLNEKIKELENEKRI